MVSGKIMTKKYYLEHYKELQGTDEGKKIELNIKRCEEYKERYLGKYMSFGEIAGTFHGMIVYTTDFKKGDDCNSIVGGTIGGISPFYHDDELSEEIESKYNDVLKIPGIW